MAGLTVLCAVLGGCALALLILRLRDRRRIRRLAAQVENFTANGGRPLDLALGEGEIDALENAVGSLQEAYLRADLLRREEQNRTSTLTADISHQLKTPLTTLRLYTELDAAPHMDAALEQITRMENLIQSLLRLERLCAGGYAFTFERQDMAALVRAQWSGLSPVYPDRRLELTGDAVVRCDRRWMGEALLNLLKNACEHTAPGGRIAVRLERTETAFFCTVEDDGGGVPEAALPELFRRFYRGENAGTQGAGIGLSIVRETVRRHFGTVTAENTAVGLKITITLPILDERLVQAEQGD